MDVFSRTTSMSSAAVIFIFFVDKCITQGKFPEKRRSCVVFLLFWNFSKNFASLCNIFLPRNLRFQYSCFSHVLLHDY